MATDDAAPGHNRLPPGFAALDRILGDEFAQGQLVNVIGLISDFRLPMPTGKTDWKCQLRFYDLSSENDDRSICLDVFRPQDEMPDAACGDVVIVFGAKVNHFRGNIALLCSWSTGIFVYQRDKIPSQHKDASQALRPLRQKKIKRRPNKNESEFVSVFYAEINKERLPTAQEFNIMKRSSTNANRAKLAELKDFKDESFVDTIAQLVRDPYDLGDRTALWISDYTEHPKFFNWKVQGDDVKDNSRNIPKNGWSGPLGRRSLQVTCWEPHASAIRTQNMTAGDWIYLRNMQIKTGNNGANLEGYVREDRSSWRGKLNVWKEPSDAEPIREEIKNALRRKRDYEILRKKEWSCIVDAAKAGAKRRAAFSSDAGQTAKKLTRKEKRRRRADEEKKQREEAKNSTRSSINVTSSSAPPDLSTSVKCEHPPGKPTTPIHAIVQSCLYEITADGNTVHIPLPFINANYRTYARVIDFFPSKLEDFARATRKSGEYCVLSDYEASDSDSSDSEADGAKAHLSSTNVLWEWRFHLRLEDASASNEQQAKESLWAVVDNNSAQLLLDLDPSDLRRDDKNLGQLRERLWQLWGNLEDQKASLERKCLVSKPFSVSKPPPDSDDEDQAQEPQLDTLKMELTNRPFECCIRQYGVKADEGNEAKADAGNGKRWQRMFGLFGTKIHKGYNDGTPVSTAD